MVTNYILLTFEYFPPLELSINSIPFNRHLTLIGHHAEQQPPRGSLGPTGIQFVQ